MSSIYKTLGLVFIGILIASFAIWKWVQKSKDFVPIAPTNIFKSIEYVEELRLSTYFFEELLILGTPENVKELRDNLQKEANVLRNKARSAQFVVDQAHNKLLEIESQIASKNPALTEARKDMLGVESLFDQINKREGVLLKMLAINDSLFGDSVKIYFHRLEEAQRNWDNRKKVVIFNPRENSINRQLKEALDLVKSLFDNAIKAEFELRENTLITKKDAVKRLEDLAKKNDKALAKKQEDAEKEWKAALKELGKIQHLVADKERELGRAENELERVIQSQGDTIKPKLMIIAQAQISAYVNLKNLKINQRQFDDTLEVYVPQPQLDSVIVMIDDDSTSLYPLSRAELDKASDEGAYYDIFQQLKNAIIQAEGRVKKRAYEAGIMAETHRLAKEYVQQFASNLNLHIVFRDSVPLPKEDLSIAPPAPKDEARDTLPKALLNSLKTLDSAAIEKRKESLQDSSLLEIH